MDLVVRDQMVECRTADALVVEPDDALARCQAGAVFVRVWRDAGSGRGGPLRHGTAARQATVDEFGQVVQDGILQQEGQREREIECGLDGETELSGQQGVPAQSIEVLVRQSLGTGYELPPERPHLEVGRGVRFGSRDASLDNPEQEGFHVLPVELAAGCARQRVEPNEGLRQELGLEPFGQERLQLIGIGGRVSR